uniref:Transposase n=1 Tax=Heterorhabditis bacteriophora TaxID=37862 RepID=A0A1I7X3X8_HETBA
MASRKNRVQTRDTAKDIMLGLAPSGQGPRQPKQGVTSYTQKDCTINRFNERVEDYYDIILRIERVHMTERVQL